MNCNTTHYRANSSSVPGDPTDYFVITAGRNDRQVRAIVDEISRQVREHTGAPVCRVEGLEAMSWVLLDYGDFVVHVFDVTSRLTYSLERLWADAPRVSLDEAEPTSALVP